jgi:hypothetical protein
MCWGAQAESRWGRRWDRVRGMHAVFTSQATDDTTAVTETTT